MSIANWCNICDSITKPLALVVHSKRNKIKEKKKEECIYIYVYIYTSEYIFKNGEKREGAKDKPKEKKKKLKNNYYQLECSRITLNTDNQQSIFINPNHQEDVIL